VSIALAGSIKFQIMSEKTGRKYSKSVVAHISGLGIYRFLK